MTAILIVDDDDDIRSLIQVAFQLAGGWNVVMAGSLAAAAHELATGSFDAVLTDNHLGDGTAADVLARAGDLPVLVLSGSVDGPPSAVVPLPGFAGGISKPFDPMTLPALVASTIRLGGDAATTDGGGSWEWDVTA